MNAPIGVFDSGVGGISVLKQALRVLPKENFIYYGDNANAPYGTKSHDDIFRLSMASAEFLANKGVKAMVVACNTATSVAISEIRRVYELPVISMEPAVKPALRYLKNGKVLVLATPATLNQQRYLNLLIRLECVGKVVSLPCKGLMELIEKAEFSDVLTSYLEEKLSEVEEPIDAVVLGCTHYVFATKQIEAAAKRKFGEHVEVVDGNLGTANQLKRVLEQKGLLGENDTRTVQLYASGDDSLFRKFLYEL